MVSWMVLRRARFAGGREAGFASCFVDSRSFLIGFSVGQPRLTFEKVFVYLAVQRGGLLNDFLCVLHLRAIGIRSGAVLFSGTIAPRILTARWRERP